MKNIKNSNTSTLIWGLIFGFIFGFLLQKGGVTKYDVIISQLLLTDFTVVKIMLSAVVVGMLGIHFMKALGWITIPPKPGTWGQNAIGGLLFGVGFALLGYCPGTLAGAIGNGYLDALAGGLIGVLLGSSILASIYPRIRGGILQKGDFGVVSLPELFKVNEWVVIIPFAAILIGVLYALENAGL